VGYCKSATRRDSDGVGSDIRGGAAVNLFRLTVAVILLMLAGLMLYAWERGKVKRFARAWAEEAIEPRIYLIKWD
jgi:Na+/H+ antiporter NhaC